MAHHPEGEEMRAAHASRRELRATTCPLAWTPGDDMPVGMIYGSRPFLKFACGHENGLRPLRELPTQILKRTDAERVADPSGQKADKNAVHLGRRVGVALKVKNLRR